MAKIEIYKQKLLVVNGTPAELEKIRTLPKYWDLPSGDAVAVPWTYEDSAWLTAMGYPSISPMPLQYDFPCPPNWTAMRHQIRIADFLIRNRRGYCLAGTGTGKTASVLWAVDYLWQLGHIKRVLVCCPLSVMLDAWGPTVPKLFFTRHAVATIRGAPEKKRRLATSDTFIHVINPDALEGVHTELMNNNYDAIVIDESTMIKNKQTNRWALMKPLVDKATWAWQLTGTPCPQGPLDAYGQLAMFNRFEVVDGRHMSFRYWQIATQIQLNKFKWVNKHDWQQTVARYMWPAIRINTRDCIDLPPRTDNRRWIALTKYQEAAIKALIKDQNIRLGGKEVTAPNRAVLMNKLAQICCGAVLDKDGEPVELQPTRRLEECNYIMGQAEGKVLIFVPFRAAVQTVAEYLRKQGWKVATVDGSTPVGQRQAIFDKLQVPGREDIDGLVAVPQCMSHGVTLTEADNVIWYAPAPSNEVYLQANARMERNGQCRSMTVTELWSHPREKELYDVIAGREKGQLTLLDICNNLLRG